MSGMVTNRQWAGSTISESCHDLVLSITSSTVLGFSAFLPAGSTPFFIENSKTNQCVVKKVNCVVQEASNMETIKHILEGRWGQRRVIELLVVSWENGIMLERRIKEKGLEIMQFGTEC
jgi:hypothetical protein